VVEASVRSKLQVKTCKIKVRVYDPIDEKVKHQPCGQEYLGATCPKKSDHLMKLKTGFCSNGWCEGKKAVDWRDRPVPTCKMFVICPCTCHDDWLKLFAMTGAERQLVESSGYRTPERTWWMPSDDPTTDLSSPSSPTPTVIVESTAPGRVPPRIVRDFGPTESGRAARGELEYWVLEQCEIWTIEEPGEPCTLTYIAEEIGRDKGITPPSVGAILSVLQRWEKLGFAAMAKKPNRFEHFTKEGLDKGLEYMKREAKRVKQREQAELKRGIR
jgi:hypothetical protein